MFYDCIHFVSREKLHSSSERNVARPLYSGYSKAKCNYELILISVSSGNWCIFVQSGELFTMKFCAGVNCYIIRNFVAVKFVYIP